MKLSLLVLFMLLLGGVSCSTFRAPGTPAPTLDFETPTERPTLTPFYTPSLTLTPSYTPVASATPSPTPERAETAELSETAESTDALPTRIPSSEGDS